MRRVSLGELQPGTMLTRPVYGASGALLLGSGKPVTSQFLESLGSWGIHSVYVDEGTTAAAAVPEDVRTTYHEALGRVKVAMEDLRRGVEVPLAEVGTGLAEFVLELAAQPGVLSCLNLLRERDDYTFHHSIDVGIVASLLGRWLRLTNEEVREAATAGVLHDFGKTKLPLEILNKPGTLTPQEFAVIRLHPKLGHEMISAALGPDSTAARVALEHHERTDGSGYPNGLCSERTLLASRIVAVADVYDAMTSRRVYHDREPEFAVLNQLQGDSFGLLDPLVTGTFLEHVAHNSRGRRVRLSNGQIGRVVFTRELRPDRPIVEVGPDLIDLAERSDIRLADEVDER